MKNYYRFQWKLLLMIVVLACASLFCGRGQQPEGELNNHKKKCPHPSSQFKKKNPSRKTRPHRWICWLHRLKLFRETTPTK